MVGWHHRLNGHEFEQAPGDGEGQGSPACCSPWDRIEPDTTAWLNNHHNRVGIIPSMQVSSYIWKSNIIHHINGLKEKSESECRSVVSNSLWSHGLCGPWNSPDQNTGVGGLSLLHGICPTQEPNPGLPHCRQILYQLSHKENTWWYQEMQQKLNKSSTHVW